MDPDLVIFLVLVGACSLVFVVISVCKACCSDSGRDDGQPPNEASAAAAAAVRQRPGGGKILRRLDKVTYRRRNAAVPASTSGGGGGGRPSTTAAAAPVSEDEYCAICLGQFEDGDLCSVMPICHHEFHRDCIANWLVARHNTCPLCRAKLQWSLVVHDMV